ncbi:MAG: transposase [Cyclobacteriaceae bacterium]|nr:MAG: transposase [Cyclobacteriaceae bacterium]
MNVRLKTKILKNNRLSYYLQYYDPGTGKRHKEYLGLYLVDKPRNEFDRNHNKETKALAQKVHSKKLLEFQEGRFGFRSKEKLKITFLGYFESIMEKKKKSSSGSNYSNWKSTLSQLRKFTRGSLKLSEIDHKFLDDLKSFFLHERIGRGDRKLSQNSAQSYFKNVKYTLREAYNEGLIMDNPSKRVKGIGHVETHREFLTEEEIQKLFDADSIDARIKNSFLFGVLTGLRFGDIQKLTWKEVQHSDDHGWFIRFQQKKTSGSETLYLNKQARELLGTPTLPEERVFKGLIYSAHNNHLLLYWVKDAGINKHITFHSARHTHACLLLAKGVDIYTVSKILGHKELKTTQIYAKVIDRNKLDAVNLIPEFG